MTRVLLAGLAVLMAAGVASGQMLYRYVDEQGQVHMTDDPNTLPRGIKSADAMAMPKGTARVARPSGMDALRQECDAQWALAHFAALTDGRPATLPASMRIRCEELEREDARRQMRR